MTSKPTKKKYFLSSDEQDESQLGKNRVGDWRAFVALAVYAKPFWKRLSLGIGLIFVSSLMAVLSARFMGDLVQKGLIPGSQSVAIQFAVVILVIELVSIVATWSGKVFVSQAASGSILKIRESLFTHLQRLPLSFYDRQPQGRIVTRITHDVEGIEQFFSNSLSRLVSACLTATMAVIAMLVTYPRLGVYLAAAVLPAFLFIFATRELVRRANRKMSRLSAACNAKLSEFLNGLEVIRAFGLEKWSKENYDEAVDLHLSSQLAANSLYAWSRPFVAFLCGLPLVALIWFGGKEILAGTLTIGLFVTYIRYCERFYNPIHALANELHIIQQAFTSAERVASFLKHKEESFVLGKDGTIAESEKLVGKIEFQNVWMAYEAENWVLRDLSFVIRPGEKVGLVGSTGCGKTSAVSLLSRLYEFQKGDVLIDGISIRDYQRAFLRQKIGFVSQDVIIFRGTLRQNLMADGDLTDQQLTEACRMTGFNKVMKERKLSFQSEILEGGANLSIGERQLLSLTRVLVRDPKILILDEATANIDPAFEMQIHHAVERAMKGRTCLIIAHRLDTLKICDRILVFELGRLVEDGAESALYQKRGHFYRLQNANQLQL